MENCLTKNPEHQRRLHDQRAGGRRCVQRRSRPPGKTARTHRLGRRRLRRRRSVKDGVIGATVQQYPLKMATLGVEADRQDRPRRREAEDHRGPRLLRHRRRARHRQARRRRRQHRLRRGREDLLGLTTDRHEPEVTTMTVQSTHARSGRRARSAGAHAEPAGPAPAARTPRSVPLILLLTVRRASPLVNSRFSNPARAVAAGPADRRRRGARGRPDADHPHRGHRPVGRRDHDPVDDGDGDPRAENGWPAGLALAVGRRRSPWRPEHSTASSSPGQPAAVHRHARHAQHLHRDRAALLRRCRASRTTGCPTCSTGPAKASRSAASG